MRVRLSIAARIFAGFIVVLAAFGAASGYAIYRMRRVRDELQLMARGWLKLSDRVAELARLQSTAAGLAATAASADEHLLLPLRVARLSREQILRNCLGALEVTRSAAVGSEAHRLVDQVERQLTAVSRAIAESDRSLRAVSSAGGQVPEQARREQRLTRRIKGLSLWMNEQLTAAAERAERDERDAIWATLGCVVVAALVGAAVTVLCQRPLRRLGRLSAATRELARGEYRARRQRLLEAGLDLRNDEVGALACELDAMAQALEQREQQLLMQERLAVVGKMAAQITHELRNPLASIGLNAELLEDELTDNREEARVLCRAIGHEVDRLADITEEYLRFARLPRLRLELESFNGVVTSAVDFLRPGLERAAIQVELRLAEPSPMVRLDEGQLRRALFNLLRNAREALAAVSHERRVVLETACHAGEGGATWATLTVQDNGPGIGADTLSRVFEPFYSTKEGGTGLGLALTQQIVAEHQGRIELRSPWPPQASDGGGALATIYLPMGTPLVSKPTPGAAPKPTQGLEGPPAAKGSDPGPNAVH